jgi:hypothetical protein
MPDSVPYVVLATPSCVEIWSGYQIQFDGMRRFAWQNVLVGELKVALAAISLEAGEGLSGIYSCTNAARCDVENRLFTNPGAAIFPAGTTAIRWERGTHVPLAPGPLDQISGLHYYRYSPSNTFRLWQVDTVMARWEGIPRCLPDDGSARPTWLALREALVTGKVGIIGRPLLAGAPFGLRIEVRAPARGPRSAPALSEALVDGVLCALHDGAATLDAPVIARALSTKLGRSAEHLLNLVMERSALLPGSPFKLTTAGIQLSPLDEFCDAGEVVIRRDPTVAKPHLSGELFTVRPVAKG